MHVLLRISGAFERRKARVPNSEEEIYDLKEERKSTNRIYQIYLLTIGSYTKENRKTLLEMS